MTQASAHAAETAPDRGRAAAIFRGVSTLMAQLGWAAIEEFPLANGRRADVFAVDAKGVATIVEVKSCLADFASDHKWPDYAPFCDRFYFAVDCDFPRERLPADTGLIVADGFGGAILRESVVTPLPAARRKAVTLAFARLAAFRLMRIPAGIAIADNRPEGLPDRAGLRPDSPPNGER